MRASPGEREEGIDKITIGIIAGYKKKNWIKNIRSPRVPRTRDKRVRSQERNHPIKNCAVSAIIKDQSQKDERRWQGTLEKQGEDDISQLSVMVPLLQTTSSGC